MRRYSYNYIIFSVILGVCNIKYFDSRGLIFLSGLQLVYIMYLATIKKDLEKAFIYHVIFILSSAAYPQNLELIESGFKMNTYSKLKIIGPLSYSYVGLLSIFIGSFLKKIEKKKSTLNKYNQFYYSTIIFLLLGTLIGISGILFDQYSIEILFKKIIYLLNFICYLFLLKKIFLSRREKILQLLVSILISSPITTIILNTLGYLGSYGGVNKYPAVDIFDYSAVLMLTILFEKKYILELGMAILSVFLGKSIYGGKGIIGVILIFIIFIFKLFSNLKLKNSYLKKRSKIILLIIIIIFLININYIFKTAIIPNKNLLISYKLKQVLDLLKIINLDNLNSLENISHSPRIRIISILNIAYHYYLYPYLLMFGIGFGGYFKDYLNLFPTLKTYDFSTFEIENNIYFSAHDSLPSIFMTSGLLGITYLCYWSGVFLKKILKNQWATLSFLWILLVFGFNHHVSILAAIGVFLCLNNIE